MKARKLTNDSVEIIVTRPEVDILRRRLNEACNGIAIPEFETRVGAEVDDVRRMLRILSEAVT